MNNYLALYCIIKLCVAQKIANSHLRSICIQLNENPNQSFTEIVSNSSLRLTAKEDFLILHSCFENIDMAALLVVALEYLTRKESIIRRSTTDDSLIQHLLDDKFGEDMTVWSKLSLAYDKITSFKPYASRVEAVTLMTKELQQNNVNEFHRHICQISLDESISQSIRSKSGGDYESRIESLLRFLGLNPVAHVHEEANPDQEHDFTFEYNDLTFGIGAKRTLRERYKQYNPSGVNVSIVFTIGLDLNREKCNTITNNYHSYIFVADEVYDLHDHLQENNKVYSASEFTLELLRGLT